MTTTVTCHAAISLSSSWTPARIRRAAHIASSHADVEMERVHAAVAGSWCVVSAQLSGTARTTETWLVHLLIELDGEDGKSEMLASEILLLN